MLYSNEHSESRLNFHRRAKIKRLNVDDRDRVVRMRAVPEGFDNVQALHSPYGAVHGLSAPSPTVGELGTHSYTQHMMRPPAIDVRRAELHEHASPTGLTPGFGGIGFSPSGSMSSSDVISPISTASNNRYPYGSPFPTPLGANPRTSNPFAQQGSIPCPVEMNRQGSHPLQPHQTRDTAPRARSESSQSPLRSGASWSGGAVDYAPY